MLKNIIELPDGTRIGSGAAVPYAIQSCTITECVNSGEELTIGSTCCACLEVQIIAKDQKLGLTAGRLIKLYKVDASGAETQVGVFRLEMPTKKSDNVYKVTAYDCISDLDKDLSQWLKSKFTNWGCTLAEFADAVCAACGLQLKSMNFPNSTFPVPKFYKSGATGRQLMQWIGEIAGCFCRATATGDIELAWYTSSGVTIRPTGERYYFSGGLTYEDYEVGTIDAVKLRLADSDSGALWPNGDADNPYIITGNPILLARVTEGLLPYLEVIQRRLAALPAYKPCKVSLPAGVDIRAGHTIQIIDKHGNQFTTCVMTKTQSGQRDTLECTGSARRDSSTAANNQTATQAARQAVENQTHEETFNRLTKNGAIQGIYVQDNKWYINAEQVTLQNLKVKAAGITGVITVQDTSGNTLFTAGENAVTIAGWKADNNSIRYGDLGASGSMWLCRTGTKNSPSSYGQTGIAGTDAAKTGWCITVGNNFGVDMEGALFATGAKITGYIGADEGSVGGWTIKKSETIQSNTGATLYEGPTLRSGVFKEDDVETEVILTPTTVYIDRRTEEGRELDWASWKKIITATNNAL